MKVVTIPTASVIQPIRAGPNSRLGTVRATTVAATTGASTCSASPQRLNVSATQGRWGQPHSTSIAARNSRSIRTSFGERTG